MRRALAGLAVALALLAAGAGAAGADTYTVTGTGDDPGLCPGGGACPSLRAALMSANATPGPDAIVFSDALGTATVTAATTLTATDQVDIDGGGDITVQQAAGATGPLLRLEPATPAAGPTPATPGAQGSRVRNITLAGPGAGAAGSTALVSTGASDVVIATSILRDAATSGASIDGSAQHVRVTQSSIFRYGTKPISFDATGVNGGIAAPASVRVGPRRADGALPVTGTTAMPGALELFGGPQLGFALGAAVGGGEFSVVPSPEPAPGETLGATLTDAAGDTSEYALATVPADVASPHLVAAVASSNNSIDILASEPIDPATVQPEDFAVQMTGVNRTVIGVSVSGDRVSLLFSDAWEAGEAGMLRLAAPGAIADAAGNVSLAPADIHVGGAPGDFIAPVVTGLRLSPSKRLCWTIGPHCKRAGAAIIFRSSENGDAWATVLRGSRRIGERRFHGQPGSNFIRFDGKVLGRRLPPGRYRMYMAMQDEVGNRTPFARQPHTTFVVKSTRR